ncbi:MAG: FAD-dependent monooxygenase, partial [Magnetospirillum sp.]|nr:FAD-dependent monooxygenase [Magnetospirillum sp.]
THATVTLADGRSLRTALVIAADGRASPTRQGAGIGLTRWEYHQSGIVCTVAHEKPHGGIAHERFLPSGPFAILPMPGSHAHPHRSSIVWTEKLHLADAIVGQSDKDFLAELDSRFGDFLGHVQLDGPRYHYPLSLQFAARAIDRRLALVGDAAHGMHPIAGQGMNMGVRDVAALAEVIVDARRLGLDVGGPDVLERFQRWRRFDNMVMLGLTDVLNRLFSNNIGPLKLARDLGLAAVQAMPGVKRVFMKHAMGVVGDLPRLMRGERL